MRLQVIWLALLGGVATYAAVAVGLLTLGDVDLAVLSPAVVRVAAVAVVLYTFGAELTRRRMVDAIPRNADDETRLARYQVAMIVGLALLESGGLLLVTLGMLSGAPGWALAGGAASLWMMARARPRPDELRLGQTERE